MANKAGYTKFRELLRYGIGSRSQRAFALQAGISYEHLNRLLNQDEIGQPSRETLEKIANAMNTVSLDELLISCGYEIADPVETARGCYAQLTGGFAFLKEKKCSSWDSPEAFLDAVNMLYGYEGGTLKVLVSGDYTPKSKEEPYAEQYAIVTFRWTDDVYSYGLAWGVLYLKTAREKTLIQEIITDRERILNMEGRIKAIFPDAKSFPDGTGCFWVRKKKGEYMAEQRLLASIFNVGDSYVRVEVGYGFPYTCAPEGFMDFLTAHADTFCVNKENSAMYQAALEPGADVDKVFASFEDRYADSSGTAAVVAYILRKETGYDFLYFPKDENVPEEEDDSCIMVEDENGYEQKMSKEMEVAIYNAAKLLKIPRFGVCYHNTMVTKTYMQDYETDNYYLEFKR